MEAGEIGVTLGFLRVFLVPLDAKSGGIWLTLGANCRIRLKAFGSVSIELSPGAVESCKREATRASGGALGRGHAGRRPSSASGKVRRSGISCRLNSYGGPSADPVRV